LTTGFDLHLPWQAYFSNNVLYGSGVVFSQFGQGDAHCPAHTTADVSLGKSFGDKLKVSFSVVNLTNSRYALSYHNDFAGTHENNPREILGSVRYHFHL
jgi:outer membrane receptor protein involved in Fe transport